MKFKKENIITHQLDESFHTVHKLSAVQSDFGLDSSAQLIEGGFGLYSSSGLKPQIGPIKSEFFRIGFVLSGTVKLDCGLENYTLQTGEMVFTFPGQVFSLRDKSDDFLAYYILFSEEFLANTMSLIHSREDYPFFSYSGTQHLCLNPAETKEIEQYILKINEEIKNCSVDIGTAIRLYLQMILLESKRSYMRQYGSSEQSAPGNTLVRNFKKLVSKHFLSQRSVANYAEMLNVSTDHLSKIVRTQTGKTAYQLIEEMLTLEAKALLRHTDLSVAEIAWRLEFSDPSHFNKFFRKRTDHTPLQYRNIS